MGRVKSTYIAFNIETFAKKLEYTSTLHLSKRAKLENTEQVHCKYND